MTENKICSTPANIGIAVVKHCGNYLIGFRSAETVLAGLAEFPGGKCEANESHKRSAVRECYEETGLQVDPVKLIYAATHSYPHGTVALEFWLCHLAGDEEQVPQNGFKWIPAAQLKELNFPEANAPLIELLQNS